MHWRTGRPADALLRERQEPLAEVLGYQDDARASRVERFMEAYYLHAENASRVSGFVIDRCLSERLSISDELVCSGNELFAAYPWVRVAQPRFLVETCQFYQELGLTPGHELRRMISQNLDNTPDLSADPEAADDFVGLMRAQAPMVSYYAGFHPAQAPGMQRPGVFDTLGLMAELGILQKLIPEFGEAYRRVPFDQIHRHTIGHHSLQTVHSLERLRTADDEKLRELVRIWGEVDAPELLYLAGLLHDVGKLGGSGHAQHGAEMARDICTRLGLEEPHIQRVEKLVLHHLLMSDTAQLRDLTLDKTISDFVALIDSVELLNMLILLTYADMEATGVLSPVKIRFLEDLYFRADHALQQGQEPPQPEAAQDRARRFRSRLSRRLSAANLTPEQIKEHTEGMPVSYLLNTRAEQIATHIRMVDALRASGPVVEFENELGGDITTMHVCTEESPEPGLLSRIAGVLYAHEIAVHGAQVFTRHSDPPLALDTLWVDFRGRAIPPFKRLEVEQDLVAVLKGGDAEEVIARMRRQLPRPLELRKVRFDSEVAEQHTVVQIEAEDQPALLYRLTRAMAALGWDIHSARISTMGDRARDVFYVTTPAGEKLEGDEPALYDAFVAEVSR
jgi:[protein-PII] uridylyltransferase